MREFNGPNDWYKYLSGLVIRELDKACPEKSGQVMRELNEVCLDKSGQVMRVFLGVRELL